MLTCLFSRIRVLTTALNVTTSIADLFKGADVEPIVHLAAQVAADRALQSKLSDGRDILLGRCLQLLVTYRSSFGASAGAQQLLLPESLKLLPLYTLAALKVCHDCSATVQLTGFRSRLRSERAPTSVPQTDLPLST
jgi:hypothetical protein